jgi:hypothetical protein
MVSKRMIFNKRIVISLVVAFVLSSCNVAAAPVVSASASATPVVPAAVFTLTPSVTEPPAVTHTATLAATETAAPTAQPPAQVNPGMNAYCRKGPGTGYDAITFLHVGTFYHVIGRNGLNTWWLVQAAEKIDCWMGDPTAVQQGPVDQVPVILVPPLPERPSTFMASYICDPASHSLQVVFDWGAEENVTGYRIYRNAGLLVELGPNIKVHHDNAAPLGVELVYELEAFNEYGVSPRVSAKISACGD